MAFRRDRNQPTDTATVHDARICVSTLYSYIDKGIFLHLTRKHLPVKKTPQKAHKPPGRSRAPKGETIERKAREVKARCSVGHWEMDTVKSGKGGRAALLVLTERLTRRQIIAKLPDTTQESVVRAMNAIERKYGKLFPYIFKTVTVTTDRSLLMVPGWKSPACGRDRE